MMPIQIPSSASLSELSKSIEVFQFLATTNGLKEALDQLAEKQAEIETATTEQVKIKQANDQDAIDNAKAKKEAEDLMKQAKAEKDESAKTVRDFEGRESRILTAEAKVQGDRDQFNSEVAAADKKYKDIIDTLNKREAAVIETETAAKALKEEYEGKLADFRKLAS